MVGEQLESVAVSLDERRRLLDREAKYVAFDGARSDVPGLDDALRGEDEPFLASEKFGDRFADAWLL